MSEILVLGAGLTGLTTALLLARDGHRITVLERDAAAPQGSAEQLWESWERPGVNQFRQPHIMLPRWRQEVQRELPEVIAELEARGGLRMNTTALLPDTVTGGNRPGDDRFDIVTARRPILEAALVAVANRTEGLEICRGAAVTGLLTIDGDEVPHVQGVLTGDGQTRRADLVVDCTGRRSTIAALLERAGATPPVEERESSGFVYYMRHFRSGTGTTPQVDGPLLQHFASLSILTLPSDAGTWSVGFVTSSVDHDLRVLRQNHPWDTALALFPSVAHWADGRAAHRRRGDSGPGGPAAALRPRRSAGRDRGGGRRRLVVVHQPVAGPGCVDGGAAGLRSTGHPARPRRRRRERAGDGVREAQRPADHPAVCRYPQPGPSPAGRDRRRHRRPGVPNGRPGVRPELRDLRGGPDRPGRAARLPGSGRLPRHRTAGAGGTADAREGDRRRHRRPAVPAGCADPAAIAGRAGPPAPGYPAAVDCCLPTGAVARRGPRPRRTGAAAARVAGRPSRLAAPDPGAGRCRLPGDRS